MLNEIIINNLRNAAEDNLDKKSIELLEDLLNKISIGETGGDDIETLLDAIIQRVKTK